MLRAGGTRLLSLGKEPVCQHVVGTFILLDLGRKASSLNLAQGIDGESIGGPDEPPGGR